MSGSRAPFTSSYHDISVPAPFENFTDEYVDLVETVEANLPKITVGESQEGALPDASGGNQDHMFITANTNGNPMGIFVSDGDSFVKQSLDTPTISVTDQLTDGTGTAIFDAGTSEIRNVSLEGSSTTVPEESLNFTGLSAGGVITGALKFDQNDDGSNQVEIVDVNTDAQSDGSTSGTDAVSAPALEVRDPNSTNGANLRVTGTIKEV